jgi:sigma-B regulation protein RsbU (phosphoserine phosphatase)
MAELPPVSLGVHIFAAYLMALIIRRPLENRWVKVADDVSQPKRQFIFDFLLGLMAGVVAASLNIVVHGFPTLSTLSLIYGVMIYSFFIALDMSLARERTIILNALANNSSQPPPRRLYSMTRRFTLVAVATALCVSVVNLSVIARDMSWLTTVGSDPAATREAILSVTYEILFIMAVLLGLAVNLIISYSRNLKLLFENETGVLERVTNGDLSRMVPVATRDEFGLIAGHTNTMIEGLRHRIELLTALQLAKEVQRNLLPSASPSVPGIEVSGTSIYCDETGGDYYDFIALPEGRLGIVVADVSGHGIDAALFMASARSFLLSQAQSFKGPAQLARDINRYVTRDSAHSGRFISMFFLEIDPAAKTLRWVRAGHEAALFHPPLTGGFLELAGEGMAMGVDEEAGYLDSSLQGWEPGTLVVVGTDGITETRSPADEFFGRERMRQIIRADAARSAAEIQAAVIEAVRSFRGEAPQEDDVTLVVVKLL